VQSDGIRAEVAIQSGVTVTRVVGGKVQGDSGASNVLTSFMTGRVREDARILKKGDRVYVTAVKAYDDSVQRGLITVDTTPIIDQGRTRQMHYKAYVVFRFPEEALRAMDATAVKQWVDPFVVSEDAATAVQTKTIALGQTMEQVKQVLGAPEKVIDLGEKTVFVYKYMKVVFINGKVADVQ
jgi:hypothetical protein